METAQLALVVSIVSAFITLGGLTWQLVLYKLSGSRIRVRLRPAVFMPIEGVLYRGDDRGQMSKGEQGFLQPDAWGIELAAVRVTNIGRVAVSVENISLDVGRSARWGLHRRTVAPRPVATHDAKNSVEQRLEPGQWVTLLYPLKGISTANKWQHADGVRVRGSARAANRRWATRSPRRLAWRLERGRDTFMGDAWLSPERRAYRTLWEETRDAQGNSMELNLWPEVLTALSEGAEAKKIEEVLSLTKRPMATAAYMTAKAYTENTERPVNENVDAS